MTNLMNGITPYLPAKHVFSIMKTQVDLSSFQKKSQIKPPADAIDIRLTHHTFIHFAAKNSVSCQITKEVCILVDLSACLFSGCMQAGTDGTVKGARDGFYRHIVRHLAPQVVDRGHIVNLAL